MTQERALSILKTGANVFLTGEPGSGKTHTVNEYISYLRDHGVEPSITASTGIAATHVGGMTIHSWSGIGIRKSLSPYELEGLGEKESLVKRISSAKVLIIDEISMLDASVLDLVEKVTRALRRRDEPFGGLQVVFVGDFFQLPPISGPGENRASFAFGSDAWRRAKPLCCYLSEQHRQEDSVYLDTLLSIRRGTVGDEVYECLETRRVDASAEVANVTRLYTHNADVDRMNLDELGKINENTRTYTMEAAGNRTLLEALKKNCLSPESLALKVGAAVMFTKNNFDVGYVNGTLGVVQSFDHDTGVPVVQTREGKMITAQTMDWAIEENGKILARVTQVPLRLAWAITVHKSQGMSLDAAIIDLSRSFEYGQGYVALSRVRTLSGLHLLGLNSRALEVHPEILSVDDRLRERSGEAEKEFEALDQEELTSMQHNFLTSIGGKLEVKKRIVGALAEKGGKLAAIREKFPNAYRPWTEDDDRKLVGMFEEGTKQRDIAAAFGRKSGAIHARLVKLGLIEEESLHS